MSKQAPNLIGKPSQEVIKYLISKHKILEFYYCAYISKGGDIFARDIRTKNLSNLDNIFTTVKTNNPEYLIGFLSEVHTKTGTGHIPMIDFSNRVLKDLGIKDIKAVLNALGETDGFILDSGGCFHYYGTRLLSIEKWREFMEKCSKQREIGEQYPKHQLRYGRANLRITTNDSKPQMPTVICRYNSNKNG